jgi:hypothetical protein
MPKISRAKLLAATTAVVVLVLACNLELLPLALLVDTVGVDVLALLLGAQLIATLPWLRGHAAAALRMASMVAGAMFAGFIGGYLRQLLLGPSAIACGSLVLLCPLSLLQEK